MDEKTKILILTTGGTIEKSYDEETGGLGNSYKGSMLQKKILPRLRYPYVDLEIRALLNKDSLQITDEDRELIKDVIKQETGRYTGIVLIHGTDTLEITSVYLSEKLKSLKGPVLITGAMRPLEVHDSDGYQNVPEAIMAAQLLSPGIYISFHGHIFPGTKAKKDRALRTFVPKE